MGLYSEGKGLLSEGSFEMTIGGIFLGVVGEAIIGILQYC